MSHNCLTFVTPIWKSQARQSSHAVVVTRFDFLRARVETNWGRRTRRSVSQSLSGGWLHNEDEVERTSHGLVLWLAHHLNSCFLPRKVRSATALAGMAFVGAGRASQNHPATMAVGRYLEGVRECAQLALTIKSGARLQSAHSVF